MKVKAEGLTEFTLRRFAQMVDVKIENYRVEHGWHVFVIRPTSKKWETIGHSGKRVHAVCWHGHREFMDRLFLSYPAAELRSTMIAYHGKDDYWHKVHEGAGYTIKAGFDSTHRCHC